MVASANVIATRTTHPIAPYIRGAVRLEEQADGMVVPWRFFPEQIEHLDQIGRYHRAAATAGVVVDFVTDGTEASLDCRVIHALDHEHPLFREVMEGGGKISLTGQLGEVMQESAKTAMSCIRQRADELGIDSSLFNTRDIHIHVPEGAVPKDGPSAGITLATAIVSGLTGIPVRGDVAMTGEITLTGGVLAIGGLREKSMAALRSGIKTVIIPASNEQDIAEFSDTVKNGIKFVPVRTVDEVFRTAFTQPPKKPKVSKAEASVAVESTAESEPTNQDTEEKENEI